jgi:DNA polymerase alpha-associated DNA helicase A
MPPEPLAITDFAAAQLSLLDLERVAEVEETQLLLSQTSPTALARAGLALLNLDIASQRTGLGGKTVVELELDSAVKTGKGELPEHGIRAGDIVSVSEQPKGSERKSDKLDLKKKGVEGVVSKVTNTSISVALDKEDADVPGGRLWLCVIFTGWLRRTLGMSRANVFVLGSSWQMISRLRGESHSTTCWPFEFGWRKLVDIDVNCF